MKNREIEEKVFQKINAFIHWNAKNIKHDYHPDVTCLIDGQMVAIELMEVLDSIDDPTEIVTAKMGLKQKSRMFNKEYFVNKICASLRKKSSKDYSVPNHEVWLVCYANHISLEGIGLFLKRHELRSIIWQCYLNHAENVDRVILVDLQSEKLIVEAIKKVIQSTVGFGDD